MTLTDQNVLDRLADLHRPPDWPEDRRAELLADILRSDPTPQRDDRHRVVVRPSRRRTVLVATVGLAAACVAVPIALPAGTPGSAGDAAAAAALHHLAVIAAAGPTNDLAADQFVHIVDDDQQNATEGQPATRSRFEYWIRPDGLTYELRSESGGGTPASEEVWLLPPGPQEVDGLTAPVHLEDLPTTPAALESYVLANSTGSESDDERVFVAVVDIVRRGLADADLRSAAIEVLAQLGHVRLDGDTHDTLGNPVQAFTFVGRSSESTTIMFDTSTAQITEERNYLDGALHATAIVPVFEVVDTVPDGVRDRAVPQH